MASPRIYPELTEDQQRLFWDKVDRGPADRCWPWLAATKGRGYGAVRVNDQPLSAHRVAWELFHGPTPEGMVVYQATCNDPACCNPAHMNVGSRSDAMHSASRHGTKLGQGVNYEEEPAAKPRDIAKPYPKLTEKQERAFWAKINKLGPDDCWLWTASGHYGAFKAGGRQLRASRVSYILAHGDIPLHLEVCHDCPAGDNPLCMNPAHLYVDTHSENLRDCVAKGRKNAARGEAAGKAKLTEAQVYEVRRRYDAHASPSLLAEEFGVSGPSICDIGTRQAWRHLPEAVGDHAELQVTIATSGVVSTSVTRPEI